MRSPHTVTKSSPRSPQPGKKPTHSNEDPTQPKIKKKKTTSCSKVKWIRSKEDSKLYMSPQKTKNGITIWYSNSTPGSILKRIESRNSNRYLYTRAHSSIIFNSQKVDTTQVSIDRWMHKQNVVYTYRGILVLKRKEILTPAISWMNLEDLVLSEINQALKDKYCVIPLMWGSYSSQIHRDRK